MDTTSTFQIKYEAFIIKLCLSFWCENVFDAVSISTETRFDAKDDQKCLPKVN